MNIPSFARCSNRGGRGRNDTQNSIVVAKRCCSPDGSATGGAQVVARASAPQPTPPAMRTPDQLPRASIPKAPRHGQLLPILCTPLLLTAVIIPIILDPEITQTAPRIINTGGNETGPGVHAAERTTPFVPVGGDVVFDVEDGPADIRCGVSVILL
ncbi:hypothetical protein GJ744_008461 [Endocarpon pusillum]|uniref:Uncharacterized protein n=1 Tax=Endocarpon pusillum TaxID=364733 RepID=A0A8H7E6W1_9EURO|nr:hypothetical protein GJ744_008461 [Endocarpon pusillum]